MFLVLALAVTAALVVMVLSLRTGSTVPAAPAPAAPEAPALHSRCQLTADAAQAWLESGAGTPTCQGPAATSEGTTRCGGCADAAEQWALGDKGFAACISR